MPHRLKMLLGCRVQCQDADVGEIRDFSLDTVSWKVRHVLVHVDRDTGPCEAFLDTSDIDEIRPRERFFLTRLTKQQVASHATVAGLKPVHRIQSTPHDYDYALAPMWEPYLSVPFSTLMLPSEMPADASPMHSQGYPVPYRHTLSEVMGWHVWTQKGRAGSLTDLIIDDATWRVTRIVARTGLWLFSRNVVLDADTIADITSGNRETGSCQDKTTAGSTPAIWSNHFAR